MQGPQGATPFSSITLESGGGPRHWQCGICLWHKQDLQMAGVSTWVLQFGAREGPFVQGGDVGVAGCGHDRTRPATSLPSQCSIRSSQLSCSRLSCLLSCCLFPISVDNNW